MHGGQEVRVGDLRLPVVLVVEDHAETTGIEHCEALVDASVRAALAEHDLARHCDRVERPRDAEFAAGGRRVDEREHVGAVGDRFAEELPAVGRRRGALKGPVLRARADLVSQGTDAGLPVVAAAGPLLPLDVATNTPASAAKRNATSSGPIDADVDPME